MVTAADRNGGIPPSFSDGWKRVFLGKPLTTEQLESERLSNPVALGALSPDAISSTAYGPEQIMIELLPRAGMASFVLLLPIIGVILFILLLVSASYRGVVMTYGRDGGVVLGDTRVAPLPLGNHHRGARPHLRCQPARIAAVGPDLCDHDLLLCRHDHV